MTKKTSLLLLLPFILILAWLALAVNPSSKKASKLPDASALSANLQQTMKEPVAREPWPRPEQVRGVYATGWIAGSAKWFPRIVSFIDQTGVNSLVIDVKDDTGTLSYHSQVPLVNAIKASQNKINNPRQMLQTLKEHQIFPIARIVVFKDPFSAKARPDWAVKDSGGGLWHDRKGLNWVDPYNKAYWDYIIAIAQEAVDLGFQEIQFDYVRFTSDGDTKRCVYPYSNGKAADDLIPEFLQYARQKLKSYQVPISADIFGLTTSAPDDLGIGQQYEKIIANVDVVCPMVYPSHYARGTFGLKNPDLNPYQTVWRGVSDAKKRLATAGNNTTVLRPWLQDFSLGNYYGRHEIQAQIKALEDAGIKEWIFWNPSCRYQIEKYQ